MSAITCREYVSRECEYVSELEIIVVSLWS